MKLPNKNKVSYTNTFIDFPFAAMFQKMLLHVVFTQK